MKINGNKPHGDPAAALKYQNPEAWLRDKLAPHADALMQPGLTREQVLDILAVVFWEGKED